MARYRMSDGASVVDTANATQHWDEDTRWNGNNHISVATGSRLAISCMCVKVFSAPLPPCVAMNATLRKFAASRVSHVRIAGHMVQAQTGVAKTTSS